MRRSVCRDGLDASTVFEPVLESSNLPLTIPQALQDSGMGGAQVSSWIGCLARSIVGGDVFPQGAMRWTC
jgi:hypothetical protein